MAYPRGRLAAVEAAADALEELDIDQSRPIDPFEVLSVLDLRTKFAPMSGLLGAIVPDPNDSLRAGVLITTERPSSVQRYTAAHEIGHWYLDQEHLAIDTEETVFGVSRIARERDAQLFASYFLMPLPLLGRVAREHGLKRRGGNATPDQVYSMSLDMNVSYQAAIIQLSNCHYIDDAARARLSKVQPAQIKKKIAGHRPTNTGSDVWVTRPEGGDARLEVFVDDDIVVELDENRTTGHFWQWESDDMLMPVVDQFQPAAAADNAIGEPRVGSGGVRRLTFVAEDDGVSSASFSYVSPFAAGHRPAATAHLDVVIRPRPQEHVKRLRLERFAREDGLLQ